MANRPPKELSKDIKELEDRLHSGIKDCKDDCTACRLQCEWRREHEHITGI